MAWLGKLGASIVIFIGSILGFSHASQIAPVPSAGEQPPVPAIQTGSDQAQASGVPVTATHSANATNASPASNDVAALMRQIGCSDASSCESACMQGGMSSACEQLRTLTSEQQSQGRSSSAYTVGSQGGGTYAGSSNRGPDTTQSPRDAAFTGDGTATNAGALPACPAGNALFDHFPMNAADLAGIEPLGHMNGEHILPNQADHVYLIARSSASTAVLAPGDATLLQVVTAVGLAGADKGSNLTTIFFSPCRSVMFALQFNALSPQLAGIVAALPPTTTQTGSILKNTVYGNLSIPLKSGEELGIVTGNNGRGGEADFAAADVRTPPWQFIDQGEATGMLADSYLHAVCPLDYFADPLRSTLSSLLTIKNAGQNGIPACGAIMQDKAGTAQGNWYRKSDGAQPYQGLDEAALLAIVHSNLDPTQGVISVGTDLIPSPMLGTQIVFTPTHSGSVDREPSEITPDGNVYCFDGPAGAGGQGAQGHVDIRLDSATKLEADYGAGSCAASPTLSSPIIYER